MAEYPIAPDLFISLQDMCKLYLLSTIEQYPVDVLAKLPLHLRKKLFMAMPVIDRLHFEGTVFLDGLEVKHNYAVLDHLNDASYRERLSDSDEVYLSWITLDESKQGMASILLPQQEYTKNKYTIVRLCALNFPVGCFDTFGKIDPIEYYPRYDSYRCLRMSSFGFKMRCKDLNYSTGRMRSTRIVNVDHVMSHPTNFHKRELIKWNVGIIPSRLSKFIRNISNEDDLVCSRMWEQYEFNPAHFETFIEYSKLWSHGIPEVLEIQCSKTLLDSPLWKYFLAKTRSQPNSSRAVYSYLEKLLLSVETLELSSIDILDITVLRDLIFPVIRLCAGHNMESRTLKAIKIMCSTSLKDALDICICVGDFLCSGYATRMSKHVINALPNKPPCPTPSDFHCNKSYLIESLSVVVKCDDLFQVSNNDEANGNSLMEVLKDILAQELTSLKHVTVISVIKGIERSMKNNRIISSFRQLLTESIYTLIPILNELIRQPQFQSLVLSTITPDLLDAFITTPATHDQLLGIDTEKRVDQSHITHSWPHIDPSDVPYSNLQFKSLDLGSWNCHLSREVMATSRILRLKMLHIPVDSLLSLPEDTIIEILHVKIDSFDQIVVSSCELDEPSDDHLHQHQYSLPLLHRVSSFLKKNKCLSILELCPCKFAVLSLVNHCLEQLIQSPVQTLEEIHLHLDTPLHSYIKTDVPQRPSSRKLNKLITKYKETLFKFFVLIRSLGKSKVCQRLIITKHDNDNVRFSCYYAYNHQAFQNLMDKIEAKQQLVQMIAEQSGDGRVPKIILKGYGTGHSSSQSEDLKIFKAIADEVVIDS